MIARGAYDRSLRRDRPELARLGRAFALSLALHLLGWGTYELGKKLELWDKLKLPTWLEQAMKRVPVLTPLPTQPPMAAAEPPLVFVDVRPSQAVSEPPPDTQFYSDKNSRAANPESERETNLPKLDGTQTEVPKTEDVERSRFNQLMPAPPPEPAREAEEKTVAKPAETAGDLTLAKPELTRREDQGQAPRTRPRTLQEARARQPESRIPGQKMRQEAGTPRIRLDPGFDAKATPFGAYDRAFIEAVSQRWYDLIESMGDRNYRQGKVVLRFHLNYDGRITDMTVVENTVTQTLSLMCQKAVHDPSPFEKWPREMRLMVGENHRKITFTFYYN